MKWYSWYSCTSILCYYNFFIFLYYLNIKRVLYHLYQSAYTNSLKKEARLNELNLPSGENSHGFYYGIGGVN